MERRNDVHQLPHHSGSSWPAFLGAFCSDPLGSAGPTPTEGCSVMGLSPTWPGLAGSCPALRRLPPLPGGLPRGERLERPAGGRHEGRQATLVVLGNLRSCLFASKRCVCGPATEPSPTHRCPRAGRGARSPARRAASPLQHGVEGPGWGTKNMTSQSPCDTSSPHAPACTPPPCCLQLPTREVIKGLRLAGC